MAQTELILIGGGGHCKSCIEVIESTNHYSIKGILDSRENYGKKVLGYTIIGTDDEIADYNNTNVNFLITIGQIKTAEPRKRIYEILQQLNVQIATIISAHARVSIYSKIGEGSIVMHNACINADSTIGNNCIINTGATVEHDCLVMDHVHLSTGSAINGMCRIGNGCFIGSNSTVSHGVSITDECVIGAGAVVLKSVTEKGTYVGNPIRFIK